MGARPTLDEPVRFPKWGSDSWHDFLVRPEDSRASASTKQPYERVIDLRQTIAEDIPETTTTFRLGNHIDEHTTVNYSDEILALAGTWRVPDELAATTTGSARVVNPNNPGAYVYSDTFPVCACGTPIRRVESSSTDFSQFPSDNEHGSDCHLGHRFRARAERVERQRDLVKRLAHLYCPPEYFKARLGYPPDYSGLPARMRDYSIDYAALLREGRRRMVRTMLVLVRSISPDTVGDIYGMEGAESAATMIRNETTADPKTLYRARVRAQSENFEFPPATPSRPPNTARTDGGDAQ